MHTIATARHAAVALAGIVIGATLAGAAQAVVETSFLYSSPQTGYLMIPSAAFAPADNANVAFANNGNTLEVTSGTRCFVAPVNLPNRAKMTQLAMWYSRNTTPGLGVGLFRVSTDFTTDEIAALTAANTGGAQKETFANITDNALRTVNNAHYGYYLYQCVPAQEQFLTARISYTYTSAGD